MPLVARGDGADTVNTVHVSVGDADPLDGIACDAAPQVIATEQCSDDVFVENIGVVRKSDNDNNGFCTCSIKIVCGCVGVSQTNDIVVQIILLDSK